ncbi:MAG: hypothetical protein ACE5NM_13575, partial [Sedimentisphaerales bacterium]
GTINGITPDEEGGFIQKVRQALASLGLFIRNGIAQIREIITDKLTAKTAQVETATVQRLQMIDQRRGCPIHS